MNKYYYLLFCVILVVVGSSFATANLIVSPNPVNVSVFKDQERFFQVGFFNNNSFVLHDVSFQSVDGFVFPCCLGRALPLHISQCYPDEHLVLGNILNDAWKDINKRLDDLIYQQMNGFPLVCNRCRRNTVNVKNPASSILDNFSLDLVCLCIVTV